MKYPFLFTQIHPPTFSPNNHINTENNRADVQTNQPENQYYTRLLKRINCLPM